MLRVETQRQQLVRLMFQGLSTAQCAKALHCSAETVRDLSATPEYQAAYAEYERQMMQTVDRAMPKLLLMAVVALARLLKHKDWRARDSAVTKILTLHGPVLQQLIARLHQVPRSTGSSEVMELDDMTPEQRNAWRDATRKYLEATRQPRMLRPGLTSQPEP